MEEDPKLKAAFELKKKIEEDLGIERRTASFRSDPLLIRTSSYDLDFGKLRRFDDLYDFSDYDLDDEKIATLMEASSFERKFDFVLFLRKKYDSLVESLKKRSNSIDKYNLFLVYMSCGKIKEALNCAMTLKNEDPNEKLGYLALSHILFFLGDERWQEYFKVYLSMTKEKLPHFVWKVFKGEEEIRFPRITERKYLLNISLFFIQSFPLTRDAVFERVCSKPFNVCSNAMCKITTLKSGLDVDTTIKNQFCYLERYARSLALYMKGDFRQALLNLPKLNDPFFMYLEALCHYALDEADGFNGLMKSISRIDKDAFIFMTLSSDNIEAPGLAEEGSAILRIKPSKLGENYYHSLRKLTFEIAKLRGYPPSKINFGMRTKRYHIMRMFFGFRSCKGVHLESDKG